MARCNVTVYEHLDGTVSVGFGPHRLGRFTAEDKALRQGLSFHYSLEADIYLAKKTGHFNLLTTPFPKMIDNVLHVCYSIDSIIGYKSSTRRMEAPVLSRN